MPDRREIHGWSLRWDEARVADARARGFWINKTVAQIAARVAEQTPDRLLVVDGCHRLTAGGIYAKATAMARNLIARGFVPGDTLSFMLPNWHEAAVIYLAAPLAGMVAHPIVPALRDNEVAFQTQDARAVCSSSPRSSANGIMSR